VKKKSIDACIDIMAHIADFVVVVVSYIVIINKRFGVCHPAKRKRYCLSALLVQSY
jgi:hypothetical protein